MRIIHHNPAVQKGWYTGPWDSDLLVSIGYANDAIDQPHLHTQITEIYLVARGSVQLLLEAQTINLQAGDLVIIDPGEVHTFRNATPDYFQLVLHLPGLTGETAQAEKILVDEKFLNL